MVNLILAFVWMMVGVGLFIWSFLNPEMNGRMQGFNMHFMGGAALVLCAYNFVRWWYTRQRNEIDWMGRPFPPRKPPRVVEYNPELDFTKEEPGEDARNQPSQDK